MQHSAQPVEPARVQSPVLCLVDYEIGTRRNSGVTACRGVHLGGVDVIRYEGIGLHRGDRKLHHIREDQSDDYLITIPLDARIEFCQAGSSARAGTGMFVALSTSRPFEASVSSSRQHQPFSALHLRLSGSLLRQRLPLMDRYCDHPLSIREGAGNIMRGLCELALTEGHALSTPQAYRLASMLTDAVANATDEAPEIRSLPNPQSERSHARVWREASCYIETNLSNPSLGIEQVARNCKVSKRYLQAAFSAFDSTISSAIRENRLNRCRESLANPQLSDRSITRIAMSWGFNDLAYFSHAYKAQFGLSPRDDRKIQLRKS
jgi:AraC-like DNA-binding protein